MSFEEIGPDEGRMSDMYRLGCKNVRDWRFRKRMGELGHGLMAKEFRFLQPTHGEPL